MRLANKQFSLWSFQIYFVFKGKESFSFIMFSMESYKGLYWFAAGWWIPKFVNISTAGDSKFVPKSGCSQSPAPLAYWKFVHECFFFQYLGVFSLWSKIKFMLNIACLLGYHAFSCIVIKEIVLKELIFHQSLINV